MTSSRRYTLLSSPVSVGPVTLENRIVFAAHQTNYATGGLPTAQHAAYYAARAEGGAGLVITEGQSVHASDWPHEKVIRGFDAAVIPAWRAITDKLHSHGTPIFAQINHSGSHGTGMYSRLALWAASPVADAVSREVPKAVEEHEIAEIIAGFATAAARCAEGGFDGVELECSGASILSGFLSPATNLRTDGYGGSLERRARLLLEILSEVRSAVGRKLAIGVRLSGDERVDPGTTLTDAIAVAKMVDEQGCADYLNASVGPVKTTPQVSGSSKHVGPRHSSLIAAAFRKAIALPVVGGGRYRDPAQAERALRAGHCDLVGIVRAQITDPQFASKALSGRTETIDLCSSCTQECVGRVRRNCSLRCTENPRAGLEAEAGSRSVAGAGSRRKVVVAGAGPGGLQAAIAAAAGGHEVIVFERANEPGGLVRLAATAPGRGELRDLVRNQVARCRELGVEIRLAAEATPVTVLAERPDVVIVATGSRPRRPRWAWNPLPGSPGLADVTEVLDGSARPSGTVLVVDELGFHQAASVAELLAAHGCAVEIATPAMVVGGDLDLTGDLEGFNMRAAARQITQSTDLLVMALEPGGVQLLHHPTGTVERRIVDWVVLAVAPASEDRLYRQLRGEAPGLDVRRVGDCLAPRRAHAAVVEGERTGASI
ncbi:MAG: mycofactocin system FadH/OYE family oxidoreductase 2 [Acidimicrobiales bacterium]